MANFPTSLYAPATVLNGDLSDASNINNPNAEVVALETKVGIDSSAVATTLDYKLKNTASIDPGHHHTTASLDSLAASKLTGQVPLANGGTNADLSATGGASKVLKQVTVGAAITVAQVTDADLSTSDITTNDVSTSKHGFTPKAPNDSTKFLRGDATWAAPAGTTGLGWGIKTHQTASGTTSITISSLDLATDGHYKVFLKVSSMSSAGSPRFVVNNDTTASKHIQAQWGVHVGASTMDIEQGSFAFADLSLLGRKSHVSEIDFDIVTGSAARPVWLFHSTAEYDGATETTAASCAGGGAFINNTNMTSLVFNCDSGQTATWDVLVLQTKTT